VIWFRAFLFKTIEWRRDHWIHGS